MGRDPLAATSRTLDAVRAFHRETDARAKQLAELHAERLHCGVGCTACCSDDLTVFEVEAERIRAEYPELLREAEPHPEGACAFLDAQGRCRIYEARPYVCRTQGLPLRWFEERTPPRGSQVDEVVERRDICPLNLPGPVLENLDPEACWLLGPSEERLRGIQEHSAGGERRRVALRRLFRRRE